VKPVAKKPADNNSEDCCSSGDPFEEFQLIMNLAVEGATECSRRRVGWLRFFVT